MDFILASNNQKKLMEMQRILEPIGVRVKTAAMLGLALCDVEETGATFEENARLKAASACRETGLPAIADDSGLEVDALDGAPGVYSARYAGEHGNDEKNNRKLLEELKDVPEGQRTGRYVCAVCCIFPDGRELMVRGTCEGEIAFAPRGAGGFGYDPLFYVNGRSFGEYTPEEKDAVSHRGSALRKLAEKLETIL
ncbi:MAG: XTP/dITP diphosphatase [Clostridiales bacterium]|nr:XTP/dITP diphosphatase [Clostridiales bacterium]